jgi:hypothetical protein
MWNDWSSRWIDCNTVARQLVENNPQRKRETVAVAVWSLEKLILEHETAIKKELAVN